MDFHNQSNVPIKIISIFNTYGPNMNPADGRIVSNFIVQVLKGEDITIFGDGVQINSFQYIDDLVERMIQMMNSEPNFFRPSKFG
jgi:UDP-glucuronate decarboxylase